LHNFFSAGVPGTFSDWQSLARTERYIIGGEMERLLLYFSAMVLACHDSSAGGPKENIISRRAYARVDFSETVRVLLPDEKTIINTLASNISRGGIFLRSDRPLPAGKRLALEFKTPQGPVVVHEGEVAWNKLRVPLGIFNGISDVPGMGIRFKSMPEESRHRIGSLVDKLLRAQQGRIEAKKTLLREHIQEATDGRDTARRLSTEYIIIHHAQTKIEPQPKKEKSKLVSAFSLSHPAITRWLLIVNGFVLFMVVAALAFLLSLKSSERYAVVQPEERAATTLSAVLPGAEPATTPEPLTSPTGYEVQAEVAPMVGPPAFSEMAVGWTVTFQASGPVESYHFLLEHPPRLIVVFRQAGYAGDPGYLESPIPFLSSLQVTRQHGYTRFSFDFEGTSIPEHTVVQGKDDVLVTFTGRR
jgi:uncharacterized protein (TIGR02266 family)